MKRTVLLLPAIALLLGGCEKEITVDLPVTEQKLVVEGTIEPGEPPLVVLTHTESFFDPTDLYSLLGIFETGAIITVDDGDGPLQLQEISGLAITGATLDRAAQLIGLEPYLIQFAGISVYTLTDGSLMGEIGRSYALSVQSADGRTATSSTRLYEVEPLDSVWFKLAEQNEDDDTLGFIWQTTSDPLGVENHYRWMARRINHDPDGTVKDAFFVSPYFASFEDKYIDGLTFDWSINRGSEPYSDDDDDTNEESGYYKRGDTVVVKFASIGRDEYEFYNSLDNNTTSQGDLFSNPSNVKSNVDGALGIWAGWTPWIDTLVCVP